MMQRTHAGAALAAGVAALLFAPTVGHGAGTAARVVDRTFLCAAGEVGGGLWGLTAATSPPKTGGQDPRTRLPGFAAHVRRNVAGGYLATVATERWPNGIAVARADCRQTAGRIGLTRRGLDGGRFSPFYEEYDCDTPRRVLMRVRAVFRGRSALAPRGDYLAASGNVQTASIAVAAYPKRKPVVFASVSPKGGRMFLASSRCVKD
jgi:hypothetical protein